MHRHRYTVHKHNRNHVNAGTEGHGGMIKSSVWLEEEYGPVNGVGIISGGRSL